MGVYHSKTTTMVETFELLTFLRLICNKGGRHSRFKNINVIFCRENGHK